MSDNPVNSPINFNPEEFGKLFAEKFKKISKEGGNLAETIPDAILEIIESCGIEVPAIVLEKIKEYRPKTRASR